MDYTTRSCREFVTVLASSEPAPGGGGASALVAALGTALGNMVGSLTVGKKKYADVEAEIIALQGKCSALQKELLDQVEDNVFPGTAGCSLTAVRYTVSLLDWCKTAGVSDTELRADLTAWVQGKGTVELARKFELVMDVYDQLMGDSAQDLLDTAGVQTDN